MDYKSKRDLFNLIQKIGQKIDDNKIIEVLKNNGGQIGFTYKSDVEDIKKVFAMSKKAYKATLTKLIEDKKIILEEDKIRLT